MNILRYFMLFMIALFLNIGANKAHAAQIDANKIVNAIYIVEGGEKAKVPYGILSVKVRNKEHARQICLNTVNNTYVRWVNSGQKGSFIEYLACRYCPPSSDPIGHKNWVKNMKFYLKGL